MTDELTRPVDLFIEMLAVERGLAANTLEAYSRDLNRLAEFLSGRGIRVWGDAARSDLRAYIADLRVCRLSERSVVRLLGTMRRFYRFLLKEEMVSRDPVPEFSARGAAGRLPGTLGSADMRALLDQPDDAKPLGARDRAMLELLYGSGLRVSELVSLKLQQINLEANYLTVRGKGAKVRLVPFGRWARDRLQRYLVEVRPRFMTHGYSDYVFPHAFGQTDHAPGVLEAAPRIRPPGRVAASGHTPYAAPFVRDRSVGGRRRPACGAVDAGPFGHRHDSDLHACEPKPHQESSSAVPSTGGAGPQGVGTARRPRIVIPAERKARNDASPGSRVVFS